MVKLSLNHKLFMALLVSSGLVYLAAGLVINARINDGFHTQAKAEAAAMGRLSQILFHEHGQKLRDSAQTIALNQGVQEALASGNEGALLQMTTSIARRLEANSITFLDRNDHIIVNQSLSRGTGNPETIGPLGSRYAMLGQATYTLESSPPEYNPSLRGFAPIYYKGAIVGVVSIGDLLSDGFAPWLKAQTAAYGAYDVDIYSTSGARLSTTGSGKQDDMVASIDRQLAARTLVDNGEPYDAVIETHGQSIGAYAWGLRDPLQHIVGAVIVQAPLTAIDLQRATTQRLFLFIGLGVAFASIFMSWILSNTLITPLRKLTFAANTIAQGNYNQPTGVSGDDEVGILALAFDQMRESIGLTTQELIGEKNVVNAILNSAGDAIIMFDAAGSYRLANERWTEFFGVDRTSLSTLSAREKRALVKEAYRDPEEYARRTSLLMAQPEKIAVEEFEQVYPQSRFLQRYSAPVYDEQHQIIGRIFVYRDITKEKQVDQLKSALVSTVSHELRTPLASIKGYARTLLLQDATWDEKERREFLEIIADESDKLEVLVNNLLQMSKIEAGVLQIERQPVCLPVLVERVLRRHQTDSTRFQVFTEFPDEFPVIEADEVCIEMVLNNLLENAVKYSPEGGSIILNGRVEEHEVVLSVTDTGLGLAVEHQEKIFDRFYRLDNGLNRKTNGSGLGLSICKGIVEAHQGRMWVASTPGQGSSFFFTLPLSPAPFRSSTGQEISSQSRSEDTPPLNYCTANMLKEYHRKQIQAEPESVLATEAVTPEEERSGDGDTTTRAHYSGGGR